MTLLPARRVEPARFRDLMSTFPSGVAVVTTVDGGGTPHGLTCSSLCSVSLSPPMLLVCVHHQSGTLGAIRERGAFAVNLLHRGGRGASETFAAGCPDRFDRVPWRPVGRRALPCLSEAAHTLAECEVRSDVPAGDHAVLIGEVVAITTLASHDPLLYGLRRYAEWPGQGPDDHS